VGDTQTPLGAWENPDVSFIKTYYNIIFKVGTFFYWAKLRPDHLGSPFLSKISFGLLLKWITKKSPTAGVAICSGKILWPVG